ncbi:GDT1-like protein 5 [Ananas comosus]|uniref:GDT1 family protein n=1 Tax=Ananas comosus TaxID=4615 RepID=A0A199VPN7_ANACO|nr:GDT1-like protein 5 [Ananas comosus]
MGLSLFQGFAKSLMMNLLSEIGDNTFFAAAVMLCYHLGNASSKGPCFVWLFSVAVYDDYTIFFSWLGCTKSDSSRVDTPYNNHFVLCVWYMVTLGRIDRRWVWDDELAEVEEKLDADSKVSSGKSNGDSKETEDRKKEQRPFLTRFFSPIFLKAFSISFVGEWGDRSQIATIGLAADENPYGVVLGGILGQALCTILAVVGGKSLASHISEKVVTLASGLLFLAFGVHSFLSSEEAS